MKEEFRDKVVGLVVRADVQLFKDQVSNVLTKASHPHHSGGCAHLLDDKERYREQVGDNKSNTTQGNRQTKDARQTSDDEYSGMEILQTNEESILP